jgi:hypothetical protein
MKMAKASKADMDMATELTNALEALSSRWGATMPEKIDRANTAEDEPFSLEDPEQCRRVCEYLIKLTRSASLCRVVWGMDVLLDPRSKVLDPDADTLAHHPETVKAKGERAVLAQLLKEADGVLATLDGEDDDTGHSAALLAQLRRDIAKALGAPADATQQGIPA